MSDITGIIDEIPSTKPKTVSAETISVEEAGKRLGVSRMCAYTAVKRGQIPSIRVGHRLVVPVAKLNEMLGVTQTREANGAADHQPLSAERQVA
jgi:excisionase family DNA binding protein